VTIAILMLGGGLVGVATGLLLVKATVFAACWRVQHSLLGGIRLGWRDAPWSAFRALLPSGLAFMAAPFGMALVNQGSIILVNHEIGPVAVVTLNVCRQLARLYLNVINALFVALQPELTRLYANRDLQGMRGLYSKSIAAVLWTALPALFVLGIFGPAAITLWTRAAVVAGAGIVIWAGLEAILASLGQNAALPAYSANRPIAVCVSFLICNAAGLTVAAALMGAHGLIVIPASFAVANLVFAGHAFYLGARVVESPMAGIAREAASPVALWQTIQLALRRTPAVSG
jgi:O-antigen/teichoic acid export membrane protein